MSYQSKRELLVQVAPRYREAGHVQKSVILDEFIAATGYARKYAIRLLSKPIAAPGPIKRPRARRYGPAVQDALGIAWAAANFICAKRLVPFLPSLVRSLEAHGHLDLSDEVRDQLLSVSAATVDRILQAIRHGDRPRGVATTKAGTLLKHQIPVRTFSDWSDLKPGFFEGDLVAHCGTSAHGSFLYSLVLTDVATGWTECAALLYRGQDTVIQALDRIRRSSPFPILGLDTDNGSEFINHELVGYCEREEITFTRGRAYKKNDQCFVEQKNGSIVRQIVGYDRYEGEAAWRQMAELYRALRLYVNFFQPSVKLRLKHREGSKVQRYYDTAQTPFQRLLATQTLKGGTATHLTRIFEALDPVRLLKQIQSLQDALWKHAIAAPHSRTEGEAKLGDEAVRFDPRACIPSGSGSIDGEVSLTPPTPVTMQETRRRKYHRKKKTLPRTHRTRLDPFAEVNDELHERLLAAPESTAKSLLHDLQNRHPGMYPDHLLRTLQRRVKDWRANLIVEFIDRSVEGDLLTETILPPSLRASRIPSPRPANDGALPG